MGERRWGKRNPPVWSVSSSSSPARITAAFETYFSTAAERGGGD